MDQPDEKPPQPQWQYKTRLPIQDQLVTVLKHTIEATKLELEAARKKLRKMKYGS